MSSFSRADHTSCLRDTIVRRHLINFRFREPFNFSVFKHANVANRGNSRQGARQYALAYVAAMSRNAGDYRPRDAQHALLYRVIDEHLDAFLRSLLVIVTYRKIYRVRRFTSPRSAGYFMTCRFKEC